MSIATKKSPKTVRTKVLTPAHQPKIVSLDAVAARAYELWLEGGKRHGHHQEHWLRAELELRK